jgi:hypothetical protein
MGNNPKTMQILIMPDNMTGRIRPAANSLGSGGLIVCVIEKSRKNNIT